MTDYLRRGRPRLDDNARLAHYKAVADVYIEAGLEGRPPVRAVEEYFAAPRSTALRWVRVARTKHGLIAPTTAGDQNYRNARALSVAQALGVSYEDLVRAIKECADGNLRIR